MSLRVGQHLAVLLQHVVVQGADAYADLVPSIRGPKDEAAALITETPRIGLCGLVYFEARLGVEYQAAARDVVSTIDETARLFSALQSLASGYLCLRQLCYF